MAKKIIVGKHKQKQTSKNVNHYKTQFGITGFNRFKRIVWDALRAKPIEKAQDVITNMVARSRVEVTAQMMKYARLRHLIIK